MKARKPSKKTPSGKKPAARKSTKPKSAAPRAPRAAKAKPAAAAKPVAPKASYPRVLTQVVRALDAKKVDALQVLDVSELSSITDFLVLGTATSQPHLRALRVELEKVIDAEKAKILGMDIGQDAGWTVVDAFDVMVHLFTPENREKYRLELLWKDAQTVPLSALL